MRLVFISDSHGRHDDLGILSGDVLIHCGDFCNGFVIDEIDVTKVDLWFQAQKFDKILCVGGNHDFVAQERSERGMSVFNYADYLEDDLCEFGGLKFYGSPWVPELSGWAYHADESQLRQNWSQIPDDVDVLITHTPPFQILDKPTSAQPVGCPWLRARVAEVNPRIHAFGHVHASYGTEDNGPTTFVNASLVDRNYRIKNQPVVIDI